MNYEALLMDLGLETRLDLAAAARSGSCTIEFGASGSGAPLEVTLEAGDQEGLPQSWLHMHAAIGKAPATGAETLFARLLELHMFGLATGQGMFGYDPTLQRVLFFKSILLVPLSQIEALTVVEEFVNQTERWRDYLPELAVPSKPLISVPNLAQTA